jgi:hypothetical protein
MKPHCSSWWHRAHVAEHGEDKPSQPDNRDPGICPAAGSGQAENSDLGQVGNGNSRQAGGGHMSGTLPAASSGKASDNVFGQVGDGDSMRVATGYWRAGSQAAVIGAKARLTEIKVLKYP